VSIAPIALLAAGAVIFLGGRRLIAYGDRRELLKL
jgi:hypothetical protein